MSIGKRISDLRKQYSYSQEYVADKVNVSRQAVSKWERDQAAPDTYNLIGITEEDLASECARAFGFERKGPKIKVKTDAAIEWLVDNQRIRIIDGKAQLIGD